MLSQETIRALYAPQPQRQGKPKARVLTAEGWQDVYKLSQTDFGTFVGNVGSTKRSRKGRTYRASNGSRRYANTTEVLAYQIY